VTYWSIVSTVHAVLTQLREDKERITDVVVEDVGGEHYSTQVQENIVKHLKKKTKQ
jgi:RNase adaptor protein for sRNA GlmZ degradation